MSVPTYTGLITALVTPFRDGRVAFDDFERLIRWQIDEGIDGIVPVGTTGESPTLDHSEHIEVVAAAVSTAGGRVPVIAGTGSNSTAEAVSLTRRADAAGADAVLVVAPYYNKPTPEGLFRHFSAVAEATAKPVVLYSIPGRCGVEISVGTVVRLRERYPHVAHIKEAGGTVDRVDQLRAALGDAVTVLSGDDSLTLPFMAVGARGVISVASNLIVRPLSELVKSALANDFARARVLHARHYRLFKDLFLESNPGPVKWLLHHVGRLSSPEVRAPLCMPSAANAAVLMDTWRELVNAEG